MYRLEITIPHPDDPKGQRIIWRDVETREEGEAWGQEAVIRYGKEGIIATFTVSTEPVQYCYSAFCGDDMFQKLEGKYDIKSKWYDNIQDAANEGWKCMKRWREYGIKPDVSQVVDSTDHIRFRLLGEGEKKPIETVLVQEGENADQLLDQIEKILNSYFQVKFGRNVGPWKENDRNVLDIAIKPPIGMPSGSIKIARESSQHASKQSDMGMRVLDVEDDGTFLVDIHDKEIVRLLKLLEKAGRKVNKVLLCTELQ